MFLDLSSRIEFQTCKFRSAICTESSGEFLRQNLPACQLSVAWMRARRVSPKKLFWKSLSKISFKKKVFELCEFSKKRLTSLKSKSKTTK